MNKILRSLQFAFAFIAGALFPHYLLTTAINTAPALPVTAFDNAKIARFSKMFAVFTAIIGVNQVETATAAGSITTSGNLTCTVTGSGIAGTPVALSVAVLNGDTAAMWAQKVRLAIVANAAISALYGVAASLGATIQLTALNPAANDATLNIALANDTSVGVTPAATSANTTAGSAAGAPVTIVGKVFDLDGKTTVIDRKVPDVTGTLRPDIHFATDAVEKITMSDIEELDTVLSLIGGLTGLVRGTVQCFFVDPRSATNTVRFLTDAFPCAVYRDGVIKGDNKVSTNPSLLFESEKGAAGPITFTPNGATS